MVVRKILEKSLPVGQTSVTFTDNDIPNSLIRVYSSDSNLFPIDRTLSGTTLTINYEAQDSIKYIALEIVKQGLDIIDNVTSTDTDAALSANQGKVLKDLIDGITPTTELTELDDVSAEDPQTGDILKYNGTSEKWEKYNLPAIPLYLGDLGDIVLDSVTNGQVLTYNGAYWTNATPTGGNSNIYSLEERQVGEWIDGKPLYQKSIKLDDLTIPQSGRVLIGLGAYISNIDNIIGGEVIIIDGSVNIVLPSFQIATMSQYGLTYTINKTDGIVISRGSDSGAVTRDFIATVRYTKTTD